MEAGNADDDEETAVEEEAEDEREDIFSDLHFPRGAVSPRSVYVASCDVPLYTFRKCTLFAAGLCAGCRTP